MLSKKVVKDIQSLGLKKERKERGLFVAEGTKIVEELLQHMPSHLETLYAIDKWQGVKDYKAAVVHVSADELKKISQLSTPNKVVAVFRQREIREPSQTGFVLYLDTIQDPGNLGTIIRIADWFGIKDVVCSPGCADVYQSKVVQSTMASLARVNVYEDKAEDWLDRQRRPVVAATLQGKPLSQFGRLEEAVLLIGNESKGVRPDFIKRASEQITIPRRGDAESLNAAVATGIILSHLLP